STACAASSTGSIPTLATSSGRDWTTGSGTSRTGCSTRRSTGSAVNSSSSSCSTTRSCGSGWHPCGSTPRPPCAPRPPTPTLSCGRASPTPSSPPAGASAAHRPPPGKVDVVVGWGVRSVGETFHAEIAGLVSGTLARWDAEETSRKLELLLGPDLQFIRINGTVVGGLVGLAIHFAGNLL